MSTSSSRDKKDTASAAAPVPIRVSMIRSLSARIRDGFAIRTGNSLDKADSKSSKQPSVTERDGEQQRQQPDESGGGGVMTRVSRSLQRTISDRGKERDGKAAVAAAVGSGGCEERRQITVAAAGAASDS